jgi:M6 family metalloprotease-like protein
MCYIRGLFFRGSLKQQKQPRKILMTKKVFKILFVLLFFLISPLSVNSQVLVSNCASEELLNSSPDNITGANQPLFPTSGTVKVLVIYCKFTDDYFDYPPYSDLWPGSLNTLPAWTLKTVARSTQEQWTDPSITGYFSDMSRGRLHVIGDVCPVLIIPRLASYYYSKAVGSNISYLVKEVLDKADPYVNFSDYDHYDPEDYNHNNKYDEPDGTADMIIICFRSIPIGISAIDNIGNYSGVASLTGSFGKFPGDQPYVIKDGIKIKAGIRGSGTFQHSIFDPDGQLHIIAHEIGHYLFSGTIGHLLGTGYYSLMSGIGCGVMCGFEREILGWVNPVMVNKNMFNVALSDAVTTGCAYKITVPNPLHNFPLHLYVENYQSSSYYINGWLRGHTGLPTLQNTGVILMETNSIVYLSDVKCADGKWDWDRRKHLWFYPSVLKDWLYSFPFKQIAPNPDSGNNEMQLVGERISPNDYTITTDHPDALGDAEDFFNPGYNDVYSPWSNPGLYPYDSAHICIELTGKIFNTIYANLYVNKPVLAKPSKPQLWKVELVNGNYPAITWLPGREPDLIKYEVFRMKGLNGYWNKIGNVNKNVSAYTDPERVSDTVFYKIRAIDNQGLQSVYSNVVSIGDGQPTLQGTENAIKFSLAQNFPNPFNPVTNISFSLPVASNVKLTIFNSPGEEVDVVFEGMLKAGKHNFQWDGTNFASGIYFYRLESPGITLTKKMVFLK